MNKIPYFETKVVKVKENKCKHKEVYYDPYYNQVRCTKCKKYFEFGEFEKIIEKNYHKGWVNGENLDAIKFPCFCRFDANKGIFGTPSGNYKVHGIGKIDKNFTEEQVQYQLSWADHQQKDLSVICETPSLKRLIEIYDIHIEKAKIVIFKEIK